MQIFYLISLSTTFYDTLVDISQNSAGYGVATKFTESLYIPQAAQSRDYHQFLTNLATPVFVLATWETGIDLVLNWVQVSRFLTYLIRSKHVLKERVSRPNHENNPKKTRIKK